MTNHCTFKQSIALKELGFDMPVRDNYREKHIASATPAKDWNELPWALSAPTRSEVLEWAREKKGIDGWVEPYLLDAIKAYFYSWLIDTCIDSSNNDYPTHAEAESALVDKIIEILKEQEDKNIHDKTSAE